MTAYAYPGSELELFRHATHWKSYWFSRIASYLQGDVLEVGAGNGNNTQFLLSRSAPRSWVSIEPDSSLAVELAKIGQSLPHAAWQLVVGTLNDMPADARFDTILYIDVLEHIEHDEQELRRAAGHLKPGGRIVVLSPALPFLYSPFDKAIGHYRRYDRAMIRKLHVPGCPLVRAEYLDSVGVLASCANRLFLRQQYPSLRQIRTWDRYFVPVSTVLDKLLFHRCGKSILAVWQRSAD